MKIFRSSAAYGLSMQWGIVVVKSECSRKKRLLDDAPSAVIATTFRPKNSMRRTASQKGVACHSFAGELNVRELQP